MKSLNFTDKWMLNEYPSFPIFKQIYREQNGKREKLFEGLKI